MKPLLSSLLFVFICVSACKKNKVQTSEVTYLKAKVANTHDISCGYPILDFSEDSLAIRAITNEQFYKFVVIGLPPAFNVKNKQLYVLVRTLKDAEEFPCLTIGIWWPHLKVLDVKDR